MVSGPFDRSRSLLVEGELVYTAIVRSAHVKNHFTPKRKNYSAYIYIYVSTEPLLPPLSFEMVRQRHEWAGGPQPGRSHQVVVGRSLRLYPMWDLNSCASLTREREFSWFCSESHSDRSHEPNVPKTDKVEENLYHIWGLRLCPL